MFTDANTQLRLLLVKRKLTFAKLVEILNEQGARKYSRTSLSNRLKSGTLRYDEIAQIADILGFKIEFSEK